MILYDMVHVTSGIYLQSDVSKNVQTCHLVIKSMFSLHLTYIYYYSLECFVLYQKKSKTISNTKMGSFSKKRAEYHTITIMHLENMSPVTSVIGYRLYDTC